MQTQGIDTCAVADVESGVDIALYQRHFEGKALERYLFGLGLIPTDIAVEPEAEVFDAEDFGY